MVKLVFHLKSGSFYKLRTALAVGIKIDRDLTVKNACLGLK